MQDLSDLLPLQHEVSIDVLPIYKGFVYTECIYYTREKSSLMKHWTKMHKNIKDNYSEACYISEELVQAHFIQNPKYFAVNPVLKEEGHHSVVYLYIEKYSEKINVL